MMENSIFSILSPEGFASILWHDSDRWQEACEKMKLTAADLNEMGICDEIVPEPSFEMEGSYAVIFRRIDEAIIRNLKPLLKTDGEELIKRRYLKLRKTGSKYGRN